MNAADMLRGWTDRALESFLAEAATQAEEITRLQAENELLRHQLVWAEFCNANLRNGGEARA